MDLARQAEVVGRIRSGLEELTGTRIKVRANMGRSKIIEREGVLTQTHPALFVVEVQEKRERTARASYQYVDVLTGTVELTNPENGESVFPWLS
ncbi:MAG TPA: Veg family protein [Coriobacteriia bacterium]|nr:Veg family protein [Coriobacteriia bacterium]